jgi:uncharacterized protein Yka (UPF0111/DUF47 family)
MLGWFHALMPREDRFFDMFEAHARLLIAGAEALDALLQGGDGNVARYSQVIFEREDDADKITRDVMIAIRRTFITPFDRGDIRSLITAMDDAIDQMQKTAKAIVLYEMHDFEPQMVEMGRAALQCARLVGEAIPLLRAIDREAAKIAGLAEQISTIEGRADELHDAGLRVLFQRHKAPNEMAFIVGSTIYENLEDVVDCFDDVGNQINSVVIEHV